MIALNLCSMRPTDLFTYSLYTDCLAPSGPHVSLATKDISDSDLPDCFRIGHRVNFEFNGITSVRTQRPRPQNIPGQYTDTDGMRYYPTRWILANVDFVGFEYIPRYPAHVSICCIAVQLNVDQVGDFSESLESSIAIQSTDTLQKNNNDKTDCIEYTICLCLLVVFPLCAMLLLIPLVMCVLC